MFSALILILGFWIPPLFVLLENVFWDIRFLQNREYHIERLYNYLRWDFGATHRATWRTALKILLFASISYFIFNPTSFIPLLGVIGVYVLWIFEMFRVWELIISRRFPAIDLEIRSVAILAVNTFAILGVMTFLSWPIVNGARGTFLGYENAGFFPQVLADGSAFIPDIYLFFIVSCLVLLAYDLASPVISLILSAITYPVEIVTTQLLIWQAQRVLSQNPKLLVIAITGSHSKTTVKELLKESLSPHFSVRTSTGTETNLPGLAKDIVKFVRPGVEILIVEMNAYQKGDIEQMTRLLPPHIALITGIDETHIGTFGNVNRTLETKAEIFQHLKPGGKIVAFGDDSLLFDMLNGIDSAILYGTELDKREYYKATKLKDDKDEFSFTLSYKEKDSKINLPKASKEFLPSVLAVLTIGHEILGVKISDLVESLGQNKFSGPLLEEVPGDNNSTLLVDNTPMSLTKFRYNLTQLTQREGKKVLITDGIPGLKKQKSKIYAEFKRQIQDNIQVVITFDKELAKLIAQDNISTEIIEVRAWDQALYYARNAIEPETIFLIAGQIGERLTGALRSEIN